MNVDIAKYLQKVCPEESVYNDHADGQEVGCVVRQIYPKIQQAKKVGLDLQILLALP